MAQTKQTPRTVVYEKLVIAPKDNKPEKDDNAPEGLSFEGVQHSLRIKKQNLSDDVNKTNKLGKLDNKIDSGGNSNEDYGGGDEGSRKSSSESPTEEEVSRNSQVDRQGDEDMSKTAGLLVLSTSESANNNETKQDRKEQDEYVLFDLGGDPERP
eukprot:8965925-Ditylum_brightwellii.AAC.1